MTDQPLSSGPAEAQLNRTPIWSEKTVAASAVLAAIIVLADGLFFRHEPGISLTLFFVAIIVGVVALQPKALRGPRAWTLLIVAVLSALPFAESENLAWFPFALGAVSVLALELGGYLARFEDWLGPVIRFAVLSPFRGIVDAIALLSEAADQKFGSRLIRLVLVWIVPVACAAVFAFLFVSANPVLDDVVKMIRLEELLKLLDPQRVFIWGFVAAMAWPVLMPRLLPWYPGEQWQGPLKPQPESLLFGTLAMRNSLLVFNALFAVQTVMDLLFLWGGVRLPDGLTYADYAHRGAYPLIATAILAGAFVLMAMRKNGPGEKSDLIRTLVYVWIAQNVWLVISSILRLDLYVETYGLTEMRIAAGVWMGLVAIGLMLIVAKIVFDQTNRWLVMANLAALMLTLWGVSFLNFPAVIAKFNVEHSYEVTGKGEGLRLDEYYMGDLGPQVIPALDEFLRTAKYADADLLKTIDILRDNLADSMIHRDIGNGYTWSEPIDRGWQSWTWRDERLRQYLKGQVFSPLVRAGNN
jgi:hypothetical protein